MSPITMMLYNNIYAAIICFVAAFGVTNQGLEAIRFCQRFPELYSDLFLFSLLAGLGQICIFFLISNFGALTCSITTDRRAHV